MFDFDPEQILADNNVTVTWCDIIVDTEGRKRKGPIRGWSLSWKHGVIYIGPCPRHKAREAAAIFVTLWLKDVPAQMAAQLIVAYAFSETYHEAIGRYSTTREGHDNIQGSIFHHE